MKPFPKYKPFTHHNTAWLLSASKEEVEAWVAECEQTRQANRKTAEEIGRLRKEAIDEIVGTVAEHSLTFNRMSATRKAIEKSATKCMDDILKALGLQSSMWCSNPVYDVRLEAKGWNAPSLTKSLWDRLESFRAFQKHQEAQAAQKRAEYVRAVQLASKHEIDPTLPEAELIRKVTSAEREAAILSVAPGTVVHHSCCDECSEWTVGERRCSCGNRRMYLEADGDIMDGFYTYAMAD